jgi:predicted TPR repeat methyltransferase
MNRKTRRANRKSVPAASDALALHARGIEAFAAGRLDIAADLIGKAIEADGQMPAFHYNLAIVRKAQGRPKDAAAGYQRAIALKPDYADAHNNLGNIFKEQGRPDHARACFEQALQARPGNVDTHYNLGVLSCDAGDREQAAAHLRICLEQDPADSRGAGILLAHLGLADVPERTTQAQLQKIYDLRSQFWDRESSYFAHHLVAEEFGKHAPGADVLDIGCGTGLVGGLVRPLAQRLDGVDLSAAMLEKAQAKHVYDRLAQADIVTFMAEHKDSYDAILGAATLIHFGDLGALFQAAHACLRDQGLFVFTLFENGKADFAVAASGKLAQSGCYAHSPAYVERAARDSGFSVLDLKQVVHEHDQDGHPVPGLVVTLRRAAAVS